MDLTFSLSPEYSKFLVKISADLNNWVTFGKSYSSLTLSFFFCKMKLVVNSTTTFLSCLEYDMKLGK